MCICATCGNVKIVIWWAQVCTGHDIGSGITSFCGAPVFSLWFANRRQVQQDGEITEHASMAQSQL